jgi:hypothetical protein
VLVTGTFTCTEPREIPVTSTGMTIKAVQHPVRLLLGVA